MAAFALAEAHVFGYDLAFVDKMSQDATEIAGTVSWCAHPSGRGHAGTARLSGWRVRSLDGSFDGFCERCDYRGQHFYFDGDWVWNGCGSGLCCWRTMVLL